MKEQFKFFAIHSPKLSKKRNSDSSSPPKKQNQAKSAEKQNKVSMPNLSGMSQIFATADNR